MFLKRPPACAVTVGLSTLESSSLFHAYQEALDVLLGARKKHAATQVENGSPKGQATY